jgi:hypothetical protein
LGNLSQDYEPLKTKAVHSLKHFFLPSELVSFLRERNPNELPLVKILLMIDTSKKYNMRVSNGVTWLKKGINSGLFEQGN